MYRNTQNCLKIFTNKLLHIYDRVVELAEAARDALREDFMESDMPKLIQESAFAGTQKRFLNQLGYRWARVVGFMEGTREALGKGRFLSFVGALWRRERS